MQKSKTNKILKIISASMALLSAVICTFAFNYSFDKASGFFNDSPLTIIFYILLTLTIAISIAAAFTEKKQDAVTEQASPMRGVIGIIMICSLTFYLISFILTPAPDYMTISLAGAKTMNLYPIIIIGLIVSLAHFVIIALFSSKVGSGAKIITGLILVLTFIIITTASYFDYTQPLNSPFKLLYEFAFIAFALYYIAELRLYSDNPRNQLMVAVSGISTALSLCAGVSVIFLMQYVSGFTVLNVASAILLATMAVCSALKLLEA